MSSGPDPSMPPAAEGVDASLDTERIRLRAQQEALARRLVLPHDGASGTIDPQGLLHVLDAASLERASYTLLRKRMAQTAALLPVSRHWMGPQFRVAFLRFVRDHRFDGPHALAREAMAFASWYPQHFDCVPWLEESLRFEAVKCRWGASRWLIVCLRLRYTVERSGTEPRRRNTWVLAWRAGRRGRIHVW